MTQQPDTEDAARPQITAEVTSPREVIINGRPHPVRDGESPYLQVYAQAQDAARQADAPALVHGVDHVRQEQSWFTMSPDGHVTALPRPTDGLPSPTAQEAESSAPEDSEPKSPEPESSEPESSEPESSEPESSEPESSAPERSGPESSVRPAGEASDPAEQDADASRMERRRLAGAAGQKAFVAAPKQKPPGGFRRFLYDISGGTINVGPTEKERRHDELAQKIARPLVGSHNTAVLSLKGGIGKTSTTVGVGMTLAEHRGDLPCAIDANPDSGDLAERALGERAFQAHRPRTITDLLRELDDVDSLTALQTYLQQAGRLHLLAGEQEPEVSDSLTADEWLRIHQEFSKYYPVLLTDCGTGVTHNAMKGILQTADNLVIAAGFAVSGAQRALQTLTWLTEHGYETLARESVVVVTDKERVSERVDKAAIKDSLRGMCRKLVVVPFDRAVVDGDRINLDMLQEETRHAYMEIAAAIVSTYR